VACTRRPWLRRLLLAESVGGRRIAAARTREWRRVMLTRLRSNSIDDLYDRVDRRPCSYWFFTYIQGADAAWHRADHRHAWELPADRAGCTVSANVTYRGVQIGQGHPLFGPTRGRCQSDAGPLDTSPKIPADLNSQVRSMSAVGEQYVDLLPARRRTPVPAVTGQ